MAEHSAIRTGMAQRMRMVVCLPVAYHSLGPLHRFRQADFRVCHPGPPLSPSSERRNYNLAPPPLGGNFKAESGDRLEDLIHQLTKPKEPKLQRRLTWKCVSDTTWPGRWS